MMKSEATWIIRLGGVCNDPRSSNRLVITTRASWMANNAIPDSIIMNMICWSLLLRVEFNEPNDDCSTEVALTSKNTLRILNTIKPVTMAFTTMDATKAVRVNMFPQGSIKVTSSFITAPSCASQVARDNKLKLAHQTKIYSLTYVCNCQEWRNNHHPDISTPHNPTTVDLWRFRWIKQVIGTMVYAYQYTLGDEVTTTSYCGLDDRNAK